MKSTGFKICLFFALFTSLFYISTKDEYNYTLGSGHCTLWADPAGYYVYLPAIFQYGFNANDLPPHIDTICGAGFGFSKDQYKKLKIKYTYGVAFLQSPFYLSTLLISKAAGIENNGFSFINMLTIDIAGIFYAALGFILLFTLLMRYFSPGVSLFATLTVFIGTNALYYSSILPGMSHAYSFFLFNACLLCFNNYLRTPTLSRFFLVGLLFAFIVLVRPLNIIFGLPLILMDVFSWTDLKQRMKLLFTFKNMTVFGLTFFFVYLPQCLYWKFYSGHYFYDAYPGEGFTFLTHPQFALFLTAPKNGMFLNNPLYLLIMLAAIIMAAKKGISGWSIVFTMLLLIYLWASWWSYTFGCGFGNRNLVEYSGLLTLPFGLFIKEYFHGRKRYFISFFILITVYANLRLMSNYEICFEGDNWDWKQFKYMLTNPKKQFRLNLDELSGNQIVKINGEKACYVNSEEMYSPGFFIYKKDLLDNSYRKLVITADILQLEDSCYAEVICQAVLKDSTTYFGGRKIKCIKGKWTKNTSMFYVPGALQQKESVVKVYIMNLKKDKLFFKNFKVVAQ